LRRGTAVIAAAAFVIFGIVVVWLLRPPPTYRRYVSPPLPDGTRYTFLYPRYYRYSLGEKELGQPSNTLQMVRLTTIDPAKGPPAEPLLYRLMPHQLRWLLPWSDQNGLGDITVMVGPAPLHSGRVLSGRKDSSWNQAPEHHHDITITDAHSGLKLTMYSMQTIPAHFAREDPVIAGSFRVLPPGTQVPKN
jgi:hypothetical protein